MGKVVRETIGSGTTAQVLDFIYDANGRPFALTYTNGTADPVTYYYVLNLQGDVVKLVELTRSGKVYNLTTVASYTYNAWGEILSITDAEGNAITDVTHIAHVNPLRYRGYYYDAEMGFYYLQSRYYDPAMHRFINADSYTNTASGVLGYNMFAYCNNNPTNNQDPTGEFAITILILIVAAVAGTAVAVHTGYEARKAGYDWADTIFYSLGSGFCTFATVYSLGMTAYGVYCNYCIMNAKTPVFEVGSKANVAAQLQTCANTANANVSGSGPTVGTNKHAVFANEVNNLGNSSLRTEVSYLNGWEVPYGTKGSIRFDVLQYNSDGVPVAAWDFKTGTAMLTMSRMAQMQAQSGLNTPIYMIK